MYIKNVALLKFLFPVILLLSSFSTALAQDIEYGVEVDTNMIVIGDHIHFKIKVKQPDNIKVLFPEFKDTIVTGIEIIEKKHLVTKKLENNWRLLEQEYVITSFDTGLYHIPAMPFTIKSENFDNIVRSNEFYIGVTSFAVDTTKGYFDIVMPIDTPLNWAEILPYGLWFLGAILVVFLLVWLIRKYKRKERVFGKIEKPKDPPHVIALNCLDRVKEDKLWQRGYVKEYYSSVTEVIREYLENQFSIRAMEQTTEEIINDVSSQELITKDSRWKLEDMLIKADFVKFAKAEPLADENHKILVDAYSIITETRKLIVAKEQKEEEKKSLEEAKEDTVEEYKATKDKDVVAECFCESKISQKQSVDDVNKGSEESDIQSMETNNN